MDRKKVKIVHPTAGESEVFELAVPAWRGAGWVPADEVEDQEPADAGQSSGEGSPPPDPGGQQAAPQEPKSGARPRRRTNEEGK
ncbi:hypothetical protein [Actinoallomurus iriomotensis]|uniref:Uncharacterized protein n=1 Tax=Actinoallomurus iriomotensis TaxID=478107 RepID=A0A9W6RXB6_9ACTN|nr:hypothetical protein [Actinoallomurus iriomotensis]GLY81837.1 hypothetical protein Airi01_101040 [Actinoallomurus iriomotensis]